jgi:hypothetical protein
MKFDFNNVDFDKIEKLADILHNSIPEDSSVFEVVAATIIIQAEVITKYPKDEGDAILEFIQQMLSFIIQEKREKEKINKCLN